MLVKLKIKLRDLKNKFFESEDIDFKTNKQKIYLFLTPLHGNLGDQAIAYSELVFLKDRYSEYEVIEIPLVEFSKKINSIKKRIQPNDMIFIHGGGNLGDIYIIEEYYRRQVIKYFKKNKIYSFPQSMAFNNIEKNREVFISNKVYSKHENFNLVIREKKSLDLANQYLNSKQISYYPDIVFYNKVNLKNNPKKDVLFLLREDVEKISNDQIVEEIISILKKNKIHKDFSDTQLDVREVITKDNRFDFLEDKLNQISDYKLIVTDRLHGMILSYIAGVPCIAMNNSTGKVESSYNDWLLESNTIKILSEDNFDRSLIEKMILDLYGRKGEDLSIDSKFSTMFH
ncbi:polysaccharide pyruvyl transferase family protein [Vagococcus fluvialis]|uniref:polysaccharide pyruvyl transferase family protein n=1 Tax=Vagococcus fluvialis TaxID=2738 RepID=UPI001D0B71D7|nr:polysaccharide pyruvyl transferase family protein [Vagococcus fluvialis]UDM70613.1 polysaccharide pyruvyl transferase family protein [Vagococcus fluvialis]UDM78033.1 polysaccharide pyruvyl transferase family protein [Vagococcus fluvialis]UDM82302.1 polysaccharide pyruvyl transferase family protein [Vagococcus fluvialis]